MFRLSKYSKAEIYEEMLNRIDEECLVEYLFENKVLRVNREIREGLKKKNKKTHIIRGILELYTKFPRIEKFIIDTWKSMFEKKIADVVEIEEQEKIIEYFDKKDFLEDKFTIATILWFQDNEELNKLGNKYYKKYLHEDKYEEGDGAMSKPMGEISNKEDTLLDMKIGDCIAFMNKYKTNNETLKKEIIKKDEKIEKLQEELHQSLKQSKENNKLIKKFEQKITKLESETKKNIKVSEDSLKSVIGQVSKICIEIAEGNENIKGSLSKLSDQNKEMVNTVKKSEQTVDEKITKIKTSIIEELHKKIRFQNEDHLEDKKIIDDSEKEVTKHLDKEKEVNKYNEPAKNVEIDKDAEAMLKELNSMFEES